MFKNPFGKKKTPTIVVTARLNAKVQPLDRGDIFEDPLDEILKERKLGEVCGGGFQRQRAAAHIGPLRQCLGRHRHHGQLRRLRQAGRPRRQLAAQRLGRQAGQGLQALQQLAALHLAAAGGQRCLGGHGLGQRGMGRAVEAGPLRQAHQAGRFGA